MNEKRIRIIKSFACPLAVYAVLTVVPMAVQAQEVDDEPVVNVEEPETVVQEDTNLEEEATVTYTVQNAPVAAPMSNEESKDVAQIGD